jgi:transcriptional regulator with XRE-family HTH domain
MSQETLEDRAEVHRTAIGHLERGERTARIDTLIKLAGSLEVEVVDLLAGLKWRPRPIVRGTMEVEDARSG